MIWCAILFCCLHGLDTSPKALDDYVEGVKELQANPLYKPFNSWETDYATHQSPPPKGIALSKHPSSTEIALLKKKLFGNVWRFVRSGNQKTMPKPKITGTRLINLKGDDSFSFAIYAKPKELAKLGCQIAEGEYASKQSTEATDRVLDVFAMADRLDNGSLTLHLVNTAIRSSAFRAINSGLTRISPKDARRLRAYAIRFTQKPTVLADMFDFSGRYSAREGELVLQEYEENKNDLEGRLSPSLAKELKTITPEQWRTASKQLSQRLKADGDAMTTLFRGPEDIWAHPGPGPKITYEDEKDVPDFRGLQRYWYEIMSCATQAPTVADAEVITRTRMRLLAIHCAIILEVAKAGRPPKTLEQILDKHELTDPITRMPWVYRVNHDRSWNLSSPGTEQSGPIELNYRRRTNEVQTR